MEAHECEFHQERRVSRVKSSREVKGNKDRKTTTGVTRFEGVVNV